MAQNLLGSGEGAQTAGDLLPDLDHPDLAFGAVVVERHADVGGESQVVVVLIDQPAGQRVVLFAQAPGAGRGGPNS
jgi:hypothetical protein